MPAFPSGYYIERKSLLGIQSKVRAERADDGTPLSQQISNADWYEYEVSIGALEKSEKQTIVDFITSNASATDVTWTLDGVNLSGRFEPIGDKIVKISMDGARYRLTFRYYAQEV